MRKIFVLSYSNDSYSWQFVELSGGEYKSLNEILIFIGSNILLVPS